MEGEFFIRVGRGSRGSTGYPPLTKYSGAGLYILSMHDIKKFIRISVHTRVLGLLMLSGNHVLRCHLLLKGS